ATPSPRTEYDPQFSRDGRRVAFESDRSGELEAWLADPDGSNAVQLTSMGAQDTGTPSWSPDGQLIAFDSNLEGQTEIYVIPASGGKPRRLTLNPAPHVVRDQTQNGRFISRLLNHAKRFQTAAIALIHQPVVESRAFAHWKQDEGDID